MGKITYRPLYKTRNEEIVAELREASGAAAPIDPYKKLKRLVAEASTLMALIHGGDWRPIVDHEEGLVAVVRRLPSSHG